MIPLFSYGPYGASYGPYGMTCQQQLSMCDVRALSLAALALGTVTATGTLGCIAEQIKHYIGASCGSGGYLLHLL